MFIYKLKLIMKSIFKVFLLSMTLMVFFTSCEEDGTITGPIVEDEVALSLSTDSGFVSSTATVNPGETFSVRLIGEKGEDDLQAIGVREDGVSLAISRFTATNSTVGGNPFTLGTAEASSFSKDITITAPTAAGDYVYSFTLTDFAGNSDTEMVTITVNVTPPSLTYMGSGVFDNVNFGDLVSLRLMASAGTSPLEQIAVYADGELVDAMDLYYGNTTNQFGGNPGALPESDTLNLDRTIYIRANKIGSAMYSIVITDQAGETANYDFVVTTGTEVKMIEGALLNSAGPSGTGGLDLDTGASIGSNAADADIKDEGIDTDLPDANNWLRQISGSNGSEIRSLVAGENGLGENFSFSDISISEQIEGIWPNGSTLSQTNEDGELITNQISGGETFVVFNGTTYFLISIKEVRNTAVGNDDEYVIDIKL